MACGQKNRTENVMLYYTGNKYENVLIDNQSFTKNRCILQATHDPKSCPITIVRSWLKALISWLTLCKSEHMNEIKANN